MSFPEGNGPRRRPGRKPIAEEPSQKRREQNKAAQLAYRQRREQHLSTLDARIKELESALSQANDSQRSLKQHVQDLEQVISAYRNRYGPLDQWDNQHMRANGHEVSSWTTSTGLGSLEAAQSLLAVSQGRGATQSDYGSRIETGQEAFWPSASAHLPSPVSDAEKNSEQYRGDEVLSGQANPGEMLCTEQCAEKCMKFIDEGLLAVESGMLDKLHVSNPVSSSTRAEDTAGTEECSKFIDEAVLAIVKEQERSGEQSSNQAQDQEMLAKRADVDVAGDLSKISALEPDPSNTNMNALQQAQNFHHSGLPFLQRLVENARFTEVDIDELLSDSKARAICLVTGQVLEYEIDQCIERHIKYAVAK